MLTTEQVSRLERLHNRHSRYEVVADNGTLKTCIGYTPRKSREGLLAACRNVGAQVIGVLGLTDDAQLVPCKRAADGFMLANWRVHFSGGRNARRFWKANCRTSARWRNRPITGSPISTRRCAAVQRTKQTNRRDENMTRESIYKSFGRTIGSFQCVRSRGMRLGPSALRDEYDKRFTRYSEENYAEFRDGYFAGFEETLDDVETDGHGAAPFWNQTGEMNQ